MSSIEFDVVQKNNRDRTHLIYSSVQLSSRSH